MAFVELKKKYRGVVYKRRAAMPFMDAYAYLDGRYRPANEEQIHREIDWFLQFYPLQPVVTLSCDRVADRPRGRQAAHYLRQQPPLAGPIAAT